MMTESRRVPLAYNAFATYFIDYATSAGRTVGYECAVAYINACDAMYLYLPFREQERLFPCRKKEVPDIGNLDKYSKGMPELFEEAKKLGLDIRYRKHIEFGNIPPPSDLWPTGFPASAAKYPDFDYAQIRKRVYVCSYLRGLEFDPLSANERRSRLRDNIRSSLWYCAQLVGAATEGEKKKLAPFAPQAFYPYFWEILDITTLEKNANWERWFEQAIDLVKACDAVFFYVPGGLPDRSSMSEGMLEIRSLAESIGLDIEYRPCSEPPETWQPPLPDWLSGDAETGREARRSTRRIYFAAPLFTQAEWQWNEKLAQLLQKRGFDVVLPQITAKPMLDGLKPFDPQSLFTSNVDDLKSSDVLLAILDQADPDSGTCWEQGYAFNAKIPVSGLRTDIRGAGDDPNAAVNLMLSKSCAEMIVVPSSQREELDWVASEIERAVKKWVPDEPAEF